MVLVISNAREHSERQNYSEAVVEVPGQQWSITTTPLWSDTHVIMTRKLGTHSATHPGQQRTSLHPSLGLQHTNASPAGCQHHRSHTFPTALVNKNLHCCWRQTQELRMEFCLLGCWSHWNVCVCLWCVFKNIYENGSPHFSVQITLFDVTWRFPTQNKPPPLETLLPCHVLPEHVQSLFLAPNWRTTCIRY